MNVKLVVVGGKQAGIEIPVTGPEFLIGRGTECQLQPRSNLVSRKHCALVIENDTLAIRDFGSTNGTLVNGERVDGRRELCSGDRIKIGVLEVDVRITSGQTLQKRPKVASVYEAAARTAAGTQRGEDLDVSSWLEAVEGDATTIAPDENTAIQDMSLTEPVDETIETPAIADSSDTVAAKKSKKGQAEKKQPGKLPRVKTLSAENSQAAAADTLRKLFNIR